MDRTCKDKIGGDGRFQRYENFKKLLHAIHLAGFLCLKPLLAAADGHGLAMHGAPELSSDFTHLPYANPDAPKGQRKLKTTLRKGYWTLKLYITYTKPFERQGLPRKRTFNPGPKLGT